jgi:uncharacterized protein YggT (Ycf19 family)
MIAIEVMCVILLFLFILYWMIQCTVTYYLFNAIDRIIKRLANHKKNKIHPIQNQNITHMVHVT